MNEARCFCNSGVIFMGRNTKRNTDNNEYRFINETIKKKPLDKKRLARKLVSIIGSGLLFGCCASAACVGMFPVFIEQFGLSSAQEPDLRIVTPPPSEDTASSVQSEEQTQASLSSEASNPLDNYTAIYSEVLRVSSNPRKALVTMKGLSQDQNMLDDTQLSYNSSQGIIFLETDTDLYILTYSDKFNDIHDLEATFQDSSTSVAKICKEDPQTGLLVARVEKSQLTSKTLQMLYVADLGASTQMPQNSPVIAIGCPSGDIDAVDYGIITSVSGIDQMADTEYSILATDMHGHPDGSGVLLDFSGNVVGIILKQGADSTETVRAWPVSQIRPLIERLTNQKAINYTGIYGTGITKAQSDRLHLPIGVYVDHVEDNSPAREAGIQSGDIITKANGTRIRTMQDYQSVLQNADARQEMQLTITRKVSGKESVELVFKLKIEER